MAFKMGLIALAVVCMAPNRRAHDHIGNFQLTVQVEGVVVGTFESAPGLDAVLDAAGTPQIVDEVVEFADGQRSAHLPVSSGRIVVHFELVEPVEGLPDGYTCALAFMGDVTDDGPDALRVEPTSAALSNCR